MYAISYILGKAIGDASSLSKANQNEIGLEMVDLAACKRIGVRLALSGEIGDYILSAQFFNELKARNAS